RLVRRDKAWCVGALMALVVGMSGCFRHASSKEDAPVPRIPRDAARFEISAQNDTAVIFRKMEARWLRNGLQGYAVDPTNRDAIVARLTLIQVDSLEARALITGQVRQVTPKDMILVLRRHRPWWRDLRFLIGL